MAAETERPAPVTLAPGVTSTPGVQGGEPCIATTRVTTDCLYGHWSPNGWDGVAAAYPTLEYLQLLSGITFEAGRRYERQQAARDKRRRWVGTITDADAHRAKGYAEGLAAAAEYLRQSGRGDWAVVLTETLGARGCDD